MKDDFVEIESEEAEGAPRGESAEGAPSLKLRTARTLKWNTLDRVTQQVALAVVGVILANLLSKEDYGLTGVLAMFQAFAIVFVDSGFGAALLQKKEPTQRDYSTVFWFNMAVATGIYVVLWFAAPLIASIFRSPLLVPLSRVMFLSFIFSALGIVQSNRLMKQMNVKQVAISNLVAVLLSGGVGVWMAFAGYGVWSLVAQALTLSFIKTAWLWVAVKWRPSPVWSRRSLREIMGVGMGVFSSSLLNTFFLNLYTFVIGWWSLGKLGLYTQADKWSKMATASLSQIITATFVPVLASVQDRIDDFRRYMRRIDRFAAMTLLPVMGGMAMTATPLFHTFFGTKWDAAILLFQILALRGIFIILISVYNNYLLAAGRAKALVVVETVKDVTMLLALGATYFTGSVTALVWGLGAASLLTWIYVLWLTSRSTGVPPLVMIGHLMPFVFYTAAALAAGWGASLPFGPAWLQLAVRIIVAVVAYVVLLKVCRVPELPEMWNYLTGRFRKKRAA